jgi:hypothetical protein
MLLLMLLLLLLLLLLIREEAAVLALQFQAFSQAFKPADLIPVYALPTHCRPTTHCQLTASAQFK